MGDFFRGWRRKAGLVTLAMACLLTVAWMRSAILMDQLSIDFGNVSLIIHSLDGSLTWQRHVQSDPLPTVVRWDTAKVTDVFDVVVVEQPNSHPPKTLWRWQWCGFDFGASQGDLCRWGNVPYWSLVLPMTLLSAWLLLIKPRPAKAAKESSHA